MDNLLISKVQETVGPRRLPRLGFAGIGWIGRSRMEAIERSGLAEIAAVADPYANSDWLPADIIRTDDFHELLELDLDGIVIATPSAQHAGQAIAALEKGLPVFCQKPLGRNREECAAVIAAARAADLLLGVDLSYRHTAAMKAVRRMVRSGELGRIVAIEAEFHNAYGPDKPWFYSRAAAGGGCLLDLGIHLVDLALWCLDDRNLESAKGWIREADEGAPGDRVESHAYGLLGLSGGVGMQLACSWKACAGRDAVIGLRFFGTDGGAAFRNVNGSFYDFAAEKFLPGGQRQTVVEPPDHWQGRAAVIWARSLAQGDGFDPSIERVAEAAHALDLIYSDARS